MDTAQSPLAHFRAACYQSFGRRRDALSDLLDAVVSGVPLTSLVRASLVPTFAHQWASVYDALSDGTLELTPLRALLTASLPPGEGRLLWAIDGSTWPRPEAHTSPERTCCRQVNVGTPESGIVAGWEYQWLMAIPEAQGSWVLPLDVRRRAPTAGSPTEVALAQLRDVLAHAPADLPRPVVVCDSHYDVPRLVRAELPIDLLARLASNRRFYRPPGPPTGRGRPRVHGPVFRLSDPATQGDPSTSQSYADPDYGAVVLTRWDNLHTQAAADVTVSVLRVEVAHLPHRETPPKPLWLCWHGLASPDDLGTLWHWYQRRFTVEHAFRLLKQTLGWTAPRLKHPSAADRWSWLLALAMWQLWLLRSLVTETRLPWEHDPPPGTALSPGRVRRAAAAFLRTVGSPARPPRPRGKSPGRQVGTCPGRSPRFPVVKRGPPAPPAPV